MTPTSEAALVARARALAGRPLRELMEGTPVRGKGAMGALIERALGLAPSSRPEPDLPALGIEVKTAPIAHGRLLESTWVCSATPAALMHETWAGSRARAKLARVLFVPVEVSAPALPERRVGTAFLWSPSPEEEATLRRDWEDLADLVAHGLASATLARRGHALQLRPKGRDARELRRATTVAGEDYLARPLGFYLRRAFVQRIIERTFGTGEEPRRSHHRS